MNAPFASEKVELGEPALWQRPEVQDWARSLIWPLGMLLFGLLVLFGLVRPTFKALAQSQPRTAAQHQLNAIESEEPERPQLTAPARSTEPAGPTAGQLAIEDARKLTRDNPAAVANIVKTWMSGEPA